ncbi:hypothetical protein [Clostridium beijerinckii]|uniref:hypothetical protein n=1 Tax=Clostridium beijerinckii TaxID=1520 RepID=UPI000478F719|nr:hypothetical protein [Clostridium beijerinckii]
MEFIVGIAVTCAIIVIALFLVVGYFVRQRIIGEVESGKENMPRYGTGVVIFMILSVLILFGFVMTYYMNPNNNDISQSGLSFSVYSVLIGMLIQIIYILITKIVNKIFKRTVLYGLSPEEIKWTFILICLALSFLCYKFNILLLSYTFWVMILGKVVWLDFNCDKFKEEVKSFKKLKASYWYVIILVGVYIFAFWRYNTIVEIISAEVGIFIGYFGGIILQHLIYNRKNNNI